VRGNVLAQWLRQRRRHVQEQPAAQPHVMRIGERAVHLPNSNDGDRCPLHGKQRALRGGKRICWVCYTDARAPYIHPRQEA
jgi:hypothetical protein